jgi:regulator of sigma E protease
LNTLLTILISVFVFGFLIFIHELGHYLTARLFKVTITEFSVGMGPRLLWYDSKKTGIRYSLAIIPIGGFVPMA